jgi:uncharacterized protein YuzE
MKEITYDQEEDILNIELQEGKYWKSVELPQNIVIDIAKDGAILSIEILKASKIFSGDARKVIEAVKASV